MDIKDVENLANLARVELPEDEKPQILKDMESILNYVKQVEALEIDESKTEDPQYNIWREDEIVPRDFSRDLIVNQQPDSKDGFLKVKKIL